MKKKTFIAFMLTLVFLLFFSKKGFCESVLEEFSKRSGELSDTVDGASTGNIDFKAFLSFFKNIFFAEALNLKNTFVSLTITVIIASLGECLSLGKSALKAVNVGINAVLVLISARLSADLVMQSSDAITQINDFMLFSVPYYCSFLCAAGKPLTAAKGSLISLGSGSILTQLIKNVFFPFANLFYITGISSSLTENDIFKSLKNMIRSAIKLVLPFTVGIYTTVLTLFLKTASHGDTLAFKTAKTALSGAIPFLGSILTQSADTIFASVGTVQGQTGIAGAICLVYILASPLIKLLTGIVMFKTVSAVSCFLGNEKSAQLFSDIAEVTEIYASITGTVGIIALITIMILTQ